MSITLKVADRDLPLKLTMRRVEILEELTGVDVMNDARGMNSPKHMVGALFALAGGEDATGLTFQAFADEITPGMMKEATNLILRVFERDAGGGEPTEGKPPADASPSKR